jgi:hypothetical protein
METDPVSETSCFYYQEHRAMEKVQKPGNHEYDYSNIYVYIIDLSVIPEIIDLIVAFIDW